MFSSTFGIVLVVIIGIAFLFFVYNVLPKGNNNLINIFQGMARSLGELM